MLKSVVSGFGFYTYFAWVCFFFFYFVICTARWFISSWLWIFSFVPALSCFPLETKPSAPSEWISIHLGSSAGINQQIFPDSSPSLCHFPSMARLPFIAPCLFGGIQFFCRGSCCGSRSTWAFPAAGPSWNTSADTTWVEWLLHELQMKCAGLNNPWRCFACCAAGMS